MILEGFEIENWSCIKRVAVDGLPPTGVTVLHGPNGTGKSSIIEALRACLMDNKSTSKALGRGTPKNSSDKPRVSVTFRAAGTVWRITKQFNSKETRLESRTAAGAWKLETADPSEAHDRTRALAGGTDSSLGLHQLLWLTQAEFRLPDPKKFDNDVQSRLRGVLGVLQTPLDDQFLDHVKQGRSRWFGARTKQGEKPKLKKDCSLANRLEIRGQLQTELDDIESRFHQYERSMERSSDLEVLSRDLRRQHEESTRLRDRLQEEYERSLTRLQGYALASDRVTNADGALRDAQALRQRRADAEQRIREAVQAAEIADREAEEKLRCLNAVETRLRGLRRDLQTLADKGHELQTRTNEVNNRREFLLLEERVKIARDNLQHVEAVDSAVQELRKQARERPGPDPAALKGLEENRSKAGKLRAKLEAAAMTLTLRPDAEAEPPRLAIDGAVAVTVHPSTAGTPIQRLVRRRAEIIIPGWGSADLTQGSDARTLDEIQAELDQLDRVFADGVSLFGVAPSDPSALDQLRELTADKLARDPQLREKQKEIDRLAPRGIDTLRHDTAQLENLKQASESDAAIQRAETPLPTDSVELGHLVEELGAESTANVEKIASIRNEIEEVEREIDGSVEPQSATGRRVAKAAEKESNAAGLRQQESAARNQHATLNATANVLADELKRVPTAGEIEESIREARAGLDEAQGKLNEARLNESEETIRDRLGATKDGTQAIQLRIDEAEKEQHQIEAVLRLTEGLHQKRATIAARLEELTRQTERELLESEAYERLSVLFEECREKRLGAVMGPIHDRVLRWMRLLRIGGYHAIGFNDQFLPEKLLAGDGAIELALEEESIGTIEQIALMVRLALGSTLSTPEEPAVALLDDPLTHSDVVRLDRMRAVLKNATTGDPDSTPPAGPLQVLVFTCHPEWFAVDGAKVIDLSKADVLSKRS